MTENIDCYSDDSIQIHGEVFDKDLDEVNYEPIEVDDSDEESAEIFGYNN